MTICLLCEHDLDKHKIDREEITNDIRNLSVKCLYEKGQYTDSSFCGCNAGFDTVEFTVSHYARRDD